MEKNLGHWECEIEIPENPYGFIYEITNTLNGRLYIGKKQMITIRKLPALKGKKNKRHKTVDTDWRIYTGSSNALNSDIEAHGKENFKFKIIRFCVSKSELMYRETKEQFDREVLLSEKYYNAKIQCHLGKVKF